MLVTLDDDAERPMDYETSLLPKVFPFCSMPNCVILLWVILNKNKNKFMFDQSGLENTFVVFVLGCFNRPHEIFLNKHNSCVLPN